MTIWGNHSNTQFPDFTNAKINGKPATRSSPTAPGWKTRSCRSDQERGKVIIDTTQGVVGVLGGERGDRSRQELWFAAPPAGDWVSAAIVSKGEYGVPAGLVFGYPCTTGRRGQLEGRRGLKLDAFGQEKFEATLKELLEEQDVVKDLLPS